MPQIVPTSQPLWQHATEATKGRRLYSLVTWKSAVLGVVCAGLAAAIFGVVAWRQSPPQPLFVPCFVTKYRASEIVDNLPGDADRDAIKAGGFFPNNTAFASYFRGPELTKRWNMLTMASADQPVVVYHSSYAILDQMGQVRLLASDSSAQSPQTALPLQLLLTKLRDCPAERKLLVLDIFCPPGRLGPWEVGGDVYEGVVRDLEEIEDPHRFVLLTSTNTPAFAEEVVGRTGFGYYFTKGLRGDADGILKDRAADGRISVREIAEYTRRWVGRWSDVTIGVTQEPKLYGQADDFDLTLCREHDSTAGQTPDTVKPMPQWLQQCWEQRDKLTEQGVELTGRGMRRLDLALLRAEQRWRFGDTSGHLREDTQSEIKLAMRCIAAAREPVLQLPPLSVALAQTQQELADIPLSWEPIQTNDASPSAEAKESSSQGSSSDEEKSNDKGAAKTSGKEASGNGGKPASNSAKGTAAASPPASASASNAKSSAAAPASTAETGPNYAAAMVMLVKAQEAWLVQAATFTPDKLPQARSADVTKTLAALEKAGLEPREIAMVIALLAAKGDLHNNEVMQWLVALDRGNSPQALMLENHVLRQLAAVSADRAAKLAASQATSQSTTANLAQQAQDLVATLSGNGNNLATEVDTNNAEFDTAYQTVVNLQQAAAHIVASTAVPKQMNESWHSVQYAIANLLAADYANEAQRNAALNQSRTVVEAAAAKVTVIAATRREVARAILLLPATAELAAREPSYAATWTATCELATKMADEIDALIADPSATSIVQLENKRLLLATRLTQLQQPASATYVERLIRQASAEDATVDTIHQIDEALLLPVMHSEDRVSLLAARQKLAEMLFASVESIKDENKEQTNTGSVAPINLPPALQMERRLQIANQLISLSGFKMPADATHAGELADRMANSKDPVVDKSSIVYKAQQLRDVVLLARRQSPLPPSAAVLRRVAVLATLDMDAMLDDPDRSPTTLFWTELADEYARMTAQWCDDASRSISGPKFYAESARRFAAVASPGNAPYVRLSQPLVLSNLARDNREDSAQVTLALLGGLEPSEPVVTVDSPCPMLTFSAEVSGTGRLRELTVSAKLADNESCEAMAGGLCKVDVAGHRFYFPVSTPKLANTDLLEIQVAETSDGPFTAVDKIELRSLVGNQPRYFRIVNHASRARTLKVVCPDVVSATTPAKPADGDKPAADPPTPQPLTAEVTVAAGDSAPITFAGKPPAAGKPLAELEGTLRFEVWENDQKVLAQAFQPAVVLPQQYVELVGGSFTPAANGKASRLEVRLRSRQLPPGPACPVSLELTPQDVPGFIESKGGQTNGSLANNDEPITLQMDGLRFDPAGELGPKHFWVGVDANPKAIGLVCTFPSSGTPVYLEEASPPQIRITAADLVKSGGSYPITLDVCGVAADASRVVVNFGTPVSSGLSVEYTTVRETGREITFGAAAGGQEGLLLLSALESNWQIEIPTDGVRGARYVEAILYDEANTELARTLHRVIVDGTPPVQVRWIDPPFLAAASKPLDLTVMGFDPESGVADVTFFVGEPADGKIPEGADQIKAVETPISGSQNTSNSASTGDAVMVWQGKLTMPKRLGVTKVTAQVTNGVGLTTFITQTLEVVQELPPAPAKIQGVITEASRPQPSLPVDLYQGPVTKRSQPVQSTTTDAVGRYTFQGLAAGNYTVSVNKTASQRSAAAEVKLKAGETKQQNVELVQ